VPGERGWDDLIEASEREIGEAWKPTQDRDCPATLVGTVAGYQQVALNTGYGPDAPWVCSVEDRDGKLWAVWLFQTVLVSEFERWRAMPGERVVIRYRGRSDKERPGLSPYHRFTLTVDRGDRGLPGFLTEPDELEPGGSEVPADSDGLEQPVDAQVVEDDDEQEGERDRALVRPRVDRGHADLPARRHGHQGTSPRPHHPGRRQTRPLPASRRTARLPRAALIMPSTHPHQRRGARSTSLMSA
jgi:hypothetical protein